MHEDAFTMAAAAEEGAVVEAVGATGTVAAPGEATVGDVASGGDFPSRKTDQGAFPSAALDWSDDTRANDARADEAERGGDVSDDVFKENADGAIQLSPTWLSGESGDSKVDSIGDNNDSAQSNINADRLWKVMKFMAAALVLFVAITIALGTALVIVATKDDGTNNGETPAVSDPAGRMDGTVLDESLLVPDGKALEFDETAFDSGTMPFVNVTAPTQYSILSPAIDATPTAETLAATSDSTTLPSANSTNRPSSSPSSNPTNRPTFNPSSGPSSAPIDPFYFGDLATTNDDLGIELSAGLSVKLIATAGERVRYANGRESEEDFHELMDGAAIVPLTDGGYVYVSNSEVEDGDGGVYGLYFDEYGDITEYKALLKDTTDNCGGGLTPWNTWISCEEYDDGQCWQIDPDPSSSNHENPKETTLGGKGGTYESVAVDNRSPERPVFFVTEDLSDGAMRRVEINGTGWGSLHREDIATTSFLRILDDSNFEWTNDEDDARDSAEEHYSNSEGIAFHEEEGRLYFMSKELKSMFVLDLDSMTYVSETTGKKFYGDGSFAAEPDQGVFGPRMRHMYFTEDGGSTPGVYARLGSTGAYYTMFQGISKDYDDDETVGVALSPDGKKFYAGIQDAGVLFEFSRDDGLPFE